ncbi:MAG TPA: response regulator [Roseiarcus sp.]|jgi:DNA-binding response OmpR family regulator
MTLPSNSAVDLTEPARVLIVEDEPLVAENLRDDLVEAGFEVVGVAPRVESALKLIEGTGFDVAILDANLAGTSAAPAAAALSARGLPFMVLSGYAREQLQREFSEAVYVQKPYRIRKLIDGLNSLLDQRRDRGAS